MPGFLMLARLSAGPLWCLCTSSLPCVVLQGVQVHGSEPSALFDQHDPYWSIHNDSRFAPQPSNYEVLSPTAMIMHHWLYNRTAWLLHSQVSRRLYIRP